MWCRTLWQWESIIWSTLLFLLHINGLPAVVDPLTRCRLFADDCLLYRVIDNIEDQLQLQKDLAALEAWAADWGMQFNASKCHVMSISRHVSQHRRRLHYMYQLCEVVLDTVGLLQEKIILASYCPTTCPCQIHTIATKAHQKLVFFPSQPAEEVHLTVRNLLMLLWCVPHLSMSLWHTQPCDLCRLHPIIWELYLQKDVDSLERVQRKATHWVTSTYDRKSSVSRLMRELQLETLQERRRIQHSTSDIYVQDSQWSGGGASRIDWFGTICTYKPRRL